MSFLKQEGDGTSLLDVLDRVLDKGIVIDSWLRVSLVGVELVTMEMRVVVASIDTYVAKQAVLAELP
jgi:hypothetical protein